MERWRMMLLHHPTHAAHAAHRHSTHTTWHAASALLLWCLDDSNLGRTEERGDTAGVLETGPDDLEWVEDTGGDHVDVLASGTVETLVEVGAELIHELADNDAALHTGVLDDSPGWAGDGVLDDADAELLVKVGWLEVAESVGGGLEESGTTTWEDTLLNGGTSGVQSINHAVLLLTDLDLGRTTDLDDGNTTGKLGETLLELLLLVVRSGWVGHDTADLLAALGNGVLAALAVEDNSVLLGDGNGTGRSEHVWSALVELDVELVSENGTVGQDTEITEDGLAVVTEAWSLDGGDLELTTELVENADGKGLAVNVLGDDDKWAAELLGSLEGWNDVLNGGDLLLGQKNKWLLELNLGGLGVGDEVWGDVTTVKLHTLGDLQLVVDGLALLDGNDTLLADLFHGAGEKSTNVSVAVGGNGSDLGDLCAGGDVALVLDKVIDNGVDGGLSSSAEIHWVATSGDVLDGLGEDGTGKNGSSGGTVTGNLVGLGSDILEETGSKVFKLVLESDGSCDSDTICIAVSIYVVQLFLKYLPYPL